MRKHTKLRAFELADEIALMIYRLTKGFPREEVYGLASQMRRAAVSVPSNIVEGCARESQIEYLRFLEIAFSSLRELHYQFGLAKRTFEARTPCSGTCNATRCTPGQEPRHLRRHRADPAARLWS